MKDERGSIGAPWGSIEEIEEALEEPKNEQVRYHRYRVVSVLILLQYKVAYRLLKTVSQDKTHFPREAVRLLLRSNLRHRVYYTKPGK